MKSTARIACLAGALTMLCLLSACSSTSTSQSGNGGSGGTPPTGGFSNASLKGSYTYKLSGTYFNSSIGNGEYQRAGTFVADGNGNITGGEDDFVLVSTLPSSNATTGTYSVSSDGTGKLTLSLGSSQIQLAMTVVAPTAVYLIEFDSTATGAGQAVAQNTSAFNTPSGTFAFRFHSNENIPSPGSVARVGSMTISSGTVTGSEDIIRLNALSSLTLTGSLVAPDMTGRGTAIFTDSAGFTLTYFYYVIDANTLNFLETDSGPVGEGRAEMQTGGPFSNSSLSNIFVFHGLGETENTVDGFHNAGAFSSDGNGNVTQGSYDAAADGVPLIDAALSGNYTMASNGRAVINLTPQGSTAFQLITWMVSSSRGFFLFNVSGIAADGTMDQQQAITASSLATQYAIVMFGHDAQSPALIDRVGVMTLDGTSAITLTDYFVNRTGSTSQTKSPAGTYSLGKNGRISASISGVSSAMALYLVSNDAGYLILGDNATEVSGSIGQQATP